MDYAKRWRQKSAYYRLQGQRHRTTGEVRFPPRPATLHEDPDAWEPCDMSGRGTLYSYSGVRQVPEGMQHYNVYPVAMVQLDEGPIIAAQLTDCDEQDLHIGQPVEMVTRRLRETGADGLLVYGYKFRPRLSDS